MMSSVQSVTLAFILRVASVLAAYENWDNDYYLFCYSSSSNRMDWDESEDYCSKYISSHLGSFGSSSELDKFENLRDEIGYHRDVWMGLFRNDDDSNWQWKDGSTVSYQNFEATSSSDEDNDELCTEINAENEKWRIEECDRNSYCFVCNTPDLGSTSNIHTITFDVDKDSDGDFYIQVYDSTGLWSEWIQYTGFYESSSIYTLFLEFDDIGYQSDIISLRILTLNNNDDLSFNSITIDNNEITLDNSNEIGENYDCEYMTLTITDNSHQSSITQQSGGDITSYCPFYWDFNTHSPSQTPSNQPTTKPTPQPSLQPSSKPTQAPTSEPTYRPTTEPTTKPSNDPTIVPTSVPSSEPTQNPTQTPTERPTEEPTTVPTEVPTTQPTMVPNTVPTMLPTDAPTKEPTEMPTLRPTSTTAPSPEPTWAPHDSGSGGSGQSMQTTLGVSGDSSDENSGQTSSVDGLYDSVDAWQTELDPNSLVGDDSLAKQKETLIDYLLYVIGGLIFVIFCMFCAFLMCFWRFYSKQRRKELESKHLQKQFDVVRKSITHHNQYLQNMPNSSNNVFNSNDTGMLFNNTFNRFNNGGNNGNVNNMNNLSMPAGLFLQPMPSNSINSVNSVNSMNNSQSDMMTGVFATNLAPQPKLNENLVYGGPRDKKNNNNNNNNNKNNNDLDKEGQLVNGGVATKNVYEDSPSVSSEKSAVANEGFVNVTITPNFDELMRNVSFKSSMNNGSDSEIENAMNAINAMIGADASGRTKNINNNVNNNVNKNVNGEDIVDKKVDEMDEVGDMPEMKHDYSFREVMDRVNRKISTTQGSDDENNMDGIVSINYNDEDAMDRQQVGRMNSSTYEYDAANHSRRVVIHRNTVSSVNDNLSGDVLVAMDAAMNNNIIYSDETKGGPMKKKHIRGYRKR